MDEVTDERALEHMRWLMSDDGRRMLDVAHSMCDVDSLRLSELLRRWYPAEYVAASLTQLELRTRAAAKFSRSDEMFFTRSGLEQSTGEAISYYRATRTPPAPRLVDLCTGIGGDLVALQKASGNVHAVDYDPVHLLVAQHNSSVYGSLGEVAFERQDARLIDLRAADHVFIDPARRTATRRLSSGTCEPPLDWCFDTSTRVSSMTIKAAAGLDLAVRPLGWEIEFVAQHNELKESVLWSPSLAQSRTRATVLPEAVSLIGDNATPRIDSTKRCGDYIIDPNPAVGRAGLIDQLADRLNGWKIDRDIAFISLSEPTSTPFGRTYAVQAQMRWDPARIRQVLRGLNAGAIDIRRRGLAGDVERVRRQLRLTGNLRFTLMMTRFQGEPWAIICSPLHGFG